MTIEQWRQLGLGGITLLFLGGAIYVLWPASTEPPRRAPAVPPPAAFTEPAPLPPPPAPEPVRETLPPRVPPPPVAQAATAPDVPLDPRERLKSLEPLRREVFAGLADLDGRVEACRLRHANLFLTLETLDQRVRVVQVRVEQPATETEEASGSAPVALDDGAARCVRGALERTIISAPSARPGRQWEMAWWPGAKP